MPSTSTDDAPLPAAARAFDAVAQRFDERFGGWRSVAAQRRAVRAVLLDAFPVGATVLEIGGGTGEDARWLARQGRQVLLTDASPAMVQVATAKLRVCGAPQPRVIAAESLDQLAAEGAGEPAFDGAFSNFAALNCVDDLRVVARPLAQLIRPGGELLLVLFGITVPGEWMVQLARGDLRAALRRFSRGAVPARLGGQPFTVRYHRARDVRRAFAPWFTLAARRGIGVAVPPSAAEPRISRHPRLLRMLESADRVLSRPLAPFGDHVLYRLRRVALAAAQERRA